MASWPGIDSCQIHPQKIPKVKFQVMLSYVCIITLFHDSDRISCRSKQHSIRGSDVILKIIMVWFGVDAEDNHSLIRECSNSSNHRPYHESDRELSISTSRHGKLNNLLDNNCWLTVEKLKKTTFINYIHYCTFAETGVHSVCIHMKMPQHIKEYVLTCGRLK